MSTSIRSPFHAVQERIGGQFDDWEGWLWTTGFGDTVGEYRAVREDVGVWDCSALIKWEVTGRDAARAVDRLWTNDVLGLASGAVRYGGLCDVSGALIDDGTAWKFADDRLWIMTNRFDLADHFEETAERLDARFTSIVHELPHVQFQGPRSRELLMSLCPDPRIADLHYFRFLPEKVPVGGVPTWIGRTGVSGELGYELFVAPSDAPALWEVLTAGPAGARPYGFDALDILRIESGMILPDYDYVPGETSPYDISFERFIRLDRPFVGREALAEVQADPPRRLVGLRFEGADAVEAGATIEDDGLVIGTVTSPTVSPTYGSIALAVVETGMARPGATVNVPTDDGLRSATIGPTSVYDPDKLRPRS